jgi:NAD(P)H-dependent FMN reductase
VILAIPGSLRHRSISAAALRAAAAAAARDGIVVRIDDFPRALPHFDPDLEPFPPEPVLRFRQACADAC